MRFLVYILGQKFSRGPSEQSFSGRIHVSDPSLRIEHYQSLGHIGHGRAESFLAYAESFFEGRAALQNVGRIKTMTCVSYRSGFNKWLAFIDLRDGRQ